MGVLQAYSLYISPHLPLSSCLDFYCFSISCRDSLPLCTRMMGRLLDLPIELLSMILKCFESFSDLYHVIQASSSIARVFWMSPEGHLSTVLSNVISEAAIPIAIAIQSLPTQKANETKCSQQEAVSDFLENWPDYWSLPSRQYDALVNMIRLHKRIKAFQEHSAALALSKCMDNKTSVEPLPWWADINLRSSHHAREKETMVNTDLTPSETERFERGFYLHEFLCRLFPRSCTTPQFDRQQDSLFSAQEQFDLFLSHLPAYSTEELNCVHQYFMGIAGKIFDQVEDEFVEDLFALADKHERYLSLQATDGSDTCGSQDDKSDKYRLTRIFTPGYLEQKGFFQFYSFEDDSNSKNASYAASLGIEYLYDLVVSSQVRRRELARQSLQASREFLREALRCLTWPLFKNLEIVDTNLRGWARNKLQDIASKPVEATNGYFNHRDLAFIFWDLQRSEENATLIWLQYTCYFGPDLLCRGWPRNKKPAGGRFDRLRLSQEDIDMLWLKYRPIQDLRNEELVESKKLRRLEDRLE